jgi:phosphoglycolate phosphatase-like HAD superfamily hydrolase
LPLDGSRIRAICFDIDGTLRDTDDQLVLRLSRLLRPAAFLLPQRGPMPLARRIVMAMEKPGNALLALADRLGIDDELERFGDLIYRLGVGKSYQSAPLIEGVGELLERLNAHFPLGIVSSRGSRAALGFLAQHGLLDFFHAVATGQTCRRMKPWPDPIYWVSDKLGVPAQACLMVGDTPVDVQAGKAAGTQTVGVLCGFGEEHELLRAGADLILPSTRMLADQFPNIFS